MIEDKVYERIEYLCKTKHYSMYRLAKESELPYSSLNNIIHWRTCPNIGTLAKLCKGFNISLSEFFNFELYPVINDDLSQEENELVNQYRNLSKKKRVLLDAYIKGLSES